MASKLPLFYRQSIFQTEWLRTTFILILALKHTDHTPHQGNHIHSLKHLWTCNLKSDEVCRLSPTSFSNCTNKTTYQIFLMMLFDNIYSCLCKITIFVKSNLRFRKCESVSSIAANIMIKDEKGEFIAGLSPSIKFTSTHLYTWVERSTLRVIPKNTM